jgi:hypothetical protein
MGLLWMWQWFSQIRKRCVIHGNSARQGLLFRETLCSHTGVEHHTLSTGEGLRMFRSKVVRSSWDCWTWRQKYIDQLTEQNVTENLNLRHCSENFTTTNFCAETSARNYQSTLRKIPKERRPHLHQVRTLKSCNCGNVMFSAISMPRECTDWGWQNVVFVVLSTCMLVISDIRKLSHSRQRARRNKINIGHMPCEHSDSDKQDTAVCKWCKFLSNSFLCMLWRYNGKESIKWVWFGSFWNVGLAYRIGIHYTGGKQLIPFFEAMKI